MSFQAQLPLRALRWPILSAWRWLVVLPGMGPSSLLMWLVVESRAQAANAGQIWLLLRYWPKPRQCFVRCCQHGAIAGAGAFCRPPPTPCSIQQEIRALSKARPRMPRPSTSPSAFSWVSGVYDKPTKLAWTLGYNSAASLSLRPWRATLKLLCSSQTPSYGSVWPLSRFCPVGGAGTARGSCPPRLCPCLERSTTAHVMPSPDWPNRASARRLTSNVYFVGGLVAVLSGRLLHALFARLL